VVVAAMVEVSIVAVVAQGAADPATAVGALALAPAGYAFSYLRRRRPSTVAKVVLAAALLVALGSFLRAVEGARSFDDARQPLAALFLWVQVLHAFDVPRRRDLGFSAVSSLMLMAEAGALSFGSGYLVFLVPWLVLAGIYLLLTLRPAPGETPAVIEVRRPVAAAVRWTPLPLARVVGAWVAAAAVATSAVFVALPRLPGAPIALPPFRADDATAISGAEGQVVNPGLAVGPDGVPEFSDLAYPGFSSSVDLRARGRLSDALVMRVRSPQAALWRGLAYDTYDGTAWTMSDDTVTTVGRHADEVFEISSMEDVLVDGRRVLATFYVEADLPNVVFGANRPVEVYFPTSQLFLDREGSLRSPILLEEGVVFSVISHVPVGDPAILRTMDAVPEDPAAASALAPYLQLPQGLPERVVALAERITAGAPTRYDAVAAVETWLRRNTEYDLGVAPDPPGVDAVDHFLFERRRGFCEHIASAMAILLRAAGVPTRLVTGFGPGDRNPFTGYWEIRASDAHAWVEVHYPGAGWIPYDPTFGVPPADPGPSGWFVAPQVLRAIGGFLSAAIPQGVRDAAKSLGRAVAAAAGAWPAVALLVATGVAGAVLVRRRRERRALGPRPTGAARAFADLEAAMAERGRPRAEHQTAREFLASLGPFLAPDERADARVVVDVFERDRFSGAEPREEDVALALRASGRLALGARGGAHRS
jgi:transglutaminase-like putative cysteine protease